MENKKNKYRGQDVVELFATDFGFNEKCEEFNLGEWYGFKKENKILRAKLVTTQDSKAKFNAYAPKEPKQLEEGADIYCIVHTIDKFTVIKIEKFYNNQVFTLNADLTIDKGEADANFPKQEFEQDGRIYKIREINETIYGIRQRIDNSERIDEMAVREILDKERVCSYCGISPEQIKKLNIDARDNLKSDFGLTIRGRGDKLEIDQLVPKGGYIKGNITLCCYWCNNAKTDTFSVKEFKEIARGINTVWNIRIKNIDKNENILFPEYSEIWKK